MNGKTIKLELPTNKDSIIDKIFDKRSEELAQENGNKKLDNTQRFLDIVSKVKDENLQNQLRSIYLKADNEVGEECARLIEKYYRAGISDGVTLIIECVNGGVKK